MRRLVPVLITALALVCAPSAAATTITGGVAHKVGTRIKGSLVVSGTGHRTGHLTIANGRARKVIGNWTARGARRRVSFSEPIPTKLGIGEWRIDGCTQGRCLRLGHFWIVDSSGEPRRPETAPAGPTPSAPVSTVPTDPISHPTDEPFAVNDGAVHYYGFVPSSYDASNRTATPLLIWLHGCYGEAEGDAWVVDPDEGQDWLTLSLAGREGGAEGVCWVPSVDEAKVMAALADFETHFNVNRQRVILAGYSSGGDLAYRTAFRHSTTFAGLLIANSTPFRDTESSAAESLAAATTKFPIVALAHEQDETYPLATVEKETNEVKAAGLPLTLIKRRGEHWNEPGEKVEGVTVPGTDADIRTYLLPYIDSL